MDASPLASTPQQAAWYDIPQDIDPYWTPTTAVAKSLFAAGLESEARRADRCPIPAFWTCDTGCREVEHWYCDLKFCESCAARRALRDAEEFLLLKGPYLRAIKEFFTLEVTSAWQPAVPTHEHIQEFAHEILLWTKQFQDPREGTGSKYRVTAQSSNDGLMHRLLAKVICWGEIAYPALHGAPGKLSFTRHQPERLREQLITTLRMEVPYRPEHQAAYELAFKEVRSMRTMGQLHVDFTKQPQPTYETVSREDLAVSNNNPLTANDETSVSSSDKAPEPARPKAPPGVRLCRKHGLPMTRVIVPPPPKGPPN